MSVVLKFDCGGVLTCMRSELAVSDVLQGAIEAAAEASQAAQCTVPVMCDYIQEWQLLLPLLRLVAGPTEDFRASCSSDSSSIDELDFSSAAVVLRIADKYNMKPVCDIVEAFLTGDKAIYSLAPATSGDPSSIWHWLHIASKLSQPNLLQYYKQRIIAERLVPNTTADVAGLHATDLAELLVAFMQANAQARYKCLGCAGRRATEVRLCSSCSFSPHIRV